MASSCTRGDSGGMSGKISQNDDEVLEQAAQGGGGVTVPGGVQEMWRCGTSGWTWGCGTWGNSGGR